MLKSLFGRFRKKETPVEPITHDTYALPEIMRAQLPRNDSAFAALDYIRELMERLNLPMTDVETILFMVGETRLVSFGEISEAIRHVGYEHLARRLKALYASGHIDAVLHPEKGMHYYPSIKTMAVIAYRT